MIKNKKYLSLTYGEFITYSKYNQFDDITGGFEYFQYIDINIGKYLII